MSGSARRVVAVVASQYEAYQRGIVEAIGTRLDAAGYGTLFFAGRDLSAEDALRERGVGDLLHPLARDLDVRGAILLSTIVGHGFTREALIEFAGALTSGPVVSLGVELPGMPSVRLDSEAALERLMAHMTADPARRRFVFLRGFVDDEDTIDRERAFRLALAARDIPVDERLVIDAHYSSAEAFSAVDALLAAGEPIDAIVAANDLMAASAVAALRLHGLSVPRDVIVSGFDDNPVAIETQPPLTTIRHRIERQARTAADLMLDALEARERGRTVDEEVRATIAARLVIRDSSGVGPVTADGDEELAAALASPARREAFRALVLERLSAVSPPPGVDVEPFADAFLDTLLDGEDGLDAAVETLLAAHPLDARRIHWWRHATRQLTVLLGRLPGEVGHRQARAPLVRALDAMNGARRASRVTTRFERFARREQQEGLLLRLAGCASHADIWSLLAEGLATIGVRRAWVALREERRDDDASLVRLAFSLDGAPLEDVAPFAPGAVLPDRWSAELERGTLVLTPLVAGELELGYLLLDPDDSAHLEIAAIAASVALALRQVRQVSDLERRADALRQANRALEDVARHDSLTGLANRSRFHENLDAALDEARADGHGIALLFLDLDGFKLINDTLGHDAGDELLRLVAARIEGVLRQGDSLARLGGDEFTVIAAEASGGERAGTRIADDVLDVVARPFRLGTRVVNVTASIGIARFPLDAEDAGTLLRNADTAMYHAKSSGKSRHASYAPELNREAMRELELREAIRAGLEAGEFHMHYQPRVDLADGRLVAFEALMRWRRGTGDDRPDTDAAVEEIGPARFIPVAERCGLIGALDAFSLDASCRQAGEWAREGTPVLVSVNLSVKRLQEPTIVEQIVAALRRHRLDPTLLELEITESAAMGDVDRNIEKLGALRALGVRVAIDDFGTGYSSLSYLRRLPVTSLKVDRSFLADVGSGRGESADAEIVRAVVALGRSLGFRIVAEGIENEAQLDFIVGLGCDEGQGYRFGRPLDVTAASARLDEERDEADSRRSGGR